MIEFDLCERVASQTLYKRKTTQCIVGASRVLYISAFVMSRRVSMQMTFRFIKLPLNCHIVVSAYIYY